MSLQKDVVTKTANLEKDVVTKTANLEKDVVTNIATQGSQRSLEKDVTTRKKDVTRRIEERCYHKIIFCLSF